MLQTILCWEKRFLNAGAVKEEHCLEALWMIPEGKYCRSVNSSVFLADPPVCGEAENGERY